MFGLSDLDDLPKVEEMAEALGMEVPAALTASSPTTESLPFEGESEGEGVKETDSSEQVH